MHELVSAHQAANGKVSSLLRVSQWSPNANDIVASTSALSIETLSSIRARRSVMDVISALQSDFRSLRPAGNVSNGWKADISGGLAARQMRSDLVQRGFNRFKD